MTPAAILKVQIAAEGTPSIMTSGASVVSAGEVFQGPRRADLSSLRQARGVIMAIGATETLPPAVLCVTERKTK
jgi:hypothetical protein